MRDFDSQNLASTAWAFATVGRRHEQLFAALGLEYKLRIQCHRGRPKLVFTGKPEGEEPSTPSNQPPECPGGPVRLQIASTHACGSMGAVMT